MIYTHGNILYYMSIDYITKAIFEWHVSLNTAFVYRFHWARFIAAVGTVYCECKQHINVSPCIKQGNNSPKDPFRCDSMRGWVGLSILITGTFAKFHTDVDSNVHSDGDVRVLIWHVQSPTKYIGTYYGAV